MGIGLPIIVKPNIGKWEAKPTMIIIVPLAVEAPIVHTSLPMVPIVLVAGETKELQKDM